MKTPEQQARDLLERIGVEDAQSFSAGDLVELANLIERVDAAERRANGMAEALKQQPANVSCAAAIKNAKRVAFVDGATFQRENPRATTEDVLRAAMKAAP